MLATLSQPNEGIRGLRWRFEYSDKLDKVGQWNFTGSDSKDQAWSQSRQNLLWAVIEAKDHNQIVHRVFECPGVDFCNFEWEAEQRFAMNGVSTQYRIVGLSLITRTERATVFISGHTKIEPRKIEDKDNLFSYGKE